MTVAPGAAAGAAEPMLAMRFPLIRTFVGGPSSPATTSRTRTLRRRICFCGASWVNEDCINKGRISKPMSARVGMYLRLIFMRILAKTEGGAEYQSLLRQVHAVRRASLPIEK